MGSPEMIGSPPRKRRALLIEKSRSNLPSTSKPLSEGADDINSGHIEQRSRRGANQNVYVKTGSHISAQSFKDIVYRCFCDDFYKPYKKLNCKLLPECCDPEACVKKHKDIQVKEINSFSNGTLFSILDNPLVNWLCDLSTAAFSALRPELYFRGDVLRILFDYILNGPEENLMWDVKHIVASHLEVHPPCTEAMRQFYLTLLSQAYRNESYFNTDLTRNGVLNHIINQLEEGHELMKPLVQEEQVEVDQQVEIGTQESSKEQEGLTQEITFEIMEQRWNNYEPLLDNEYNEVLDALEDLGKCTQETDESVVMKNKTMPRLAIALELIVDILEADFLICVSKLKMYISSESPKRPVPLVKCFMDESLHDRVFQLYVKTSYLALWTQLSRLMSVMAEFEHLFKPFTEQLWQYPNLHPDCERFATSLCNSISKCNWGEEERLLRLQLLHPPWLQLQVAMHWVNSDLKVSMGSDLKALVDIIHMHIISPMKLEKDTHFKIHDIAVHNQSPDFVKKATKKNQYGETKLHRICKQKVSSKSMFFILLSSPAVDVNAKDHFGWTPLHETVLTQSVFKTKALLQYQPPPGRKPVDLGAQNSEGSTPLHEAVITDNLEICRLLVDYGGACLLRKTDCEGVTPLQLAKENAEISRFFDRVIKTQEMLNLSPDSVLNLPESVAQLLVVACNAFLADHHTWEVYHMMKFNPTHKKLEPKKWIIVDQNTLLRLKNDQDEFRKLRKILNKLAENPKNSSLISLWDSKFQNVAV